MPIDIPPAFLAKAEKSSIVSLGECDHYIKEKYEYQLDLIRALAPLGFKSIGIESGYFAIKGLDRVETAADSPCAPAYADGVLGINAAIYEEFLLRITAAEDQFFDELKELGFEKGKQVFGFDLDTDPELVSQVDTGALSDLELKVVRSSLSFCERAHCDTSEEDLLEALSRREELMEKIVFERLLQNDKIILLGHNGHFAKSSSEYALVDELQADQASPSSWKILGERLKQRGIESLCVFQLGNEGSHSAPFRERIPFEISEEEGTYEAALAKGHPWPVLLPASQLVSDFGRLDLRENFESRIRGKVEEMSDWIMYFPFCSGI